MDDKAQMSFIIESPYIAALKREHLLSYCSFCFQSASIRCVECQSVVYCDDQCREKDRVVHQRECQFIREKNNEDVLLRMLIRVISRLEVDQGEPEVDLWENLPPSIRRRCWSDLLSHRDQLIHSERHRDLWIQLNDQLQRFFPGQFDQVDLFDIFGKLLINRFRVGIHRDLREGRIAIGWAIYLTTSVFNHSCEPDLFQCSFNLKMRLKLNSRRLTSIPEDTASFNRLTVSYRHQNDFRLKDELSYIPMRDERRRFVSFFFFRCHCRWCDDEQRNQHEEFLSNRLCSHCGEFLLLRPSHQHDNQWIFICPNTNQIIDRMTLTNDDDLRIYENVFHQRSVVLNQKKEKLFFIYRKETKNAQLAIQLGEELIEFYDHYFHDSSIYPKMVLVDLISLHQSTGQVQRAKELNEKLEQLWKEDYSSLLPSAKDH